MSKEINEGDWKALRKIIPELRERYIGRLNGELRQMLESSAPTATECFWNAHEKMTKESALIQNCLDDVRRSRMHQMIYAMLDCGMMHLKDLSIFSEELQGRAKLWYEENKSN